MQAADQDKNNATFDRETYVKMLIALGAGLLHLVFVSTIGRLPRAMGAALSLAYGVFLYTGLSG